MTSETKAPPSIPAWASSVGLISLGEAIPPADADAVAQRLLITERIARYCWAYDERQLDRLSDCFTEDGIWEGDVLGRVPIGPFKGRAAIREWMSGFWPHQHDQRRHMILNTIVEGQTKDSARTCSYLLLMGSPGREVSVETIGFYRVDLTRVGDQWLINHLMAAFDKAFWPGDLDNLSPRGRARHGVREDARD